MNDSQPSQVYAAVDLGSNSFHMLIGQYENGQLRVIDREKDMVRLAAGLTDRGKLSRKVFDRALDCIRRFGQLTRDMHADVVRAVGTDALRRATNADDFLLAAEKILGHPINVISGQEEARLVYLGAIQSLPAFDGERLVVDIGGGSTELIRGRNLEPLALHSLDLGCVSVTEEYFPGGKITIKRWKRARRAALYKLKPLRPEIDGWGEVIGTSGTIRCIARVLLRQEWSKDCIDLRGLEKLQKYMLGQGRTEALDLSGLSDRRAPVFVGGVVILQAVFSALRIDKMQAASGALREGLIYDMLANTLPE